MSYPYKAYAIAWIVVSNAWLEQTELIEYCAFAAKSVTPLAKPSKIFEEEKKIRNSPNQP